MFGKNHTRRLYLTPILCLSLLNSCNNINKKLLVISFTWSSASIPIYSCVYLQANVMFSHEGICCVISLGRPHSDLSGFMYSFHDRNKYLHKIYGSLWQNMAKINTSLSQIYLLWSIQIYLLAILLFFKRVYNLIYIT